MLSRNTTVAAPDTSEYDGAGVKVNGVPSFSQSSLIIPFCDDINSTLFSGALALSGLSSANIKVTVKTKSICKFTIQVWSSSCQIISVASDSGSVLTSLSI
jgi:hypothetical protein